MAGRAAFALLIALMCTCPLAGQQTDKSDETNQSKLAGTWMGGIGSLDDQRFSWNIGSLELKQHGTGLKGKLKTNDQRIYSIKIFIDGDRANVKVRRRRIERTFSGEMTDGVLDAKANDDDSPSRLVLRRIHSIPAEQLEKFTGMFEVGEGHRINIRSRGPGLAMTDYQSGQVRYLYPVSDDRFVSGMALAVPAPVEFEFQFRKDTDDSISDVQIKSAGKSTLVAKRQTSGPVEDFVYKSFDGVRIEGTLSWPSGEGPFPAIVFVHGSGQATRSGAGSWPHYFASLGFAVLAVDKRGVGESGGSYQLPDGGRDNFPHMRRRSKDVAAAVNALAKLEDIDGQRIGLSGASQAGWVIPMAATRSDIDFAIILSGGATPLSVEGRYSRLASENSSGSQLPEVDELIEELRSYRPTDIGIETELAQMNAPCLWLYGYKDRSNPSQICESLIKRIASQHDRDFTVKSFPDGNHSLMVCRFGGGAEVYALDRLVPGLHSTIEQWLAEKQLRSK